MTLSVMIRLKHFVYHYTLAFYCNGTAAQIEMFILPPYNATNKEL
jgi:hypothetical protein